MRALSLLFIIAIGVFSCSKSAGNSTDPEQSEELIPSNVTTVVADADLIGDWLYVGSKVAYAPYFIPAKGDSVFISFRSNNTYVDSSKIENLDHGVFMIIDSSLGNGQQMKVLNKTSSAISGSDTKEFYKISFIKDTLILEINNQGIIDSRYIKMNPLD